MSNPSVGTINDSEQIRTHFGINVSFNSTQKKFIFTMNNNYDFKFLWDQVNINSAASILGFYNIYKEGSAELNFLAIIAVIFSFIFSYFTVAIFLNFIKKFSLNVFIIYRIILSLILLAIAYL